MEEELLQRAVEELMRREESMSQEDAQAAVGLVAEYIRAYTHLEEVPEGLFYTLVEMAQQGQIGGDIEEIYEGDTRIKYRSGGTMQQYMAVLSRYRRMSHET